MTPVRLHVHAPLFAGASIEASPDQARHLGTVMRRSPGDPVLLFNGRDGEWGGRIATLSRGRATMAADAQARVQQDDLDLWLVFALLKRDATDLVVQKATELGVSSLLPVFTERTNAARVNAERLRSIATEAAEQSERLTVPVVQAPRALDAVMDGWPGGRPLFAAVERGRGPSLAAAAGPAALLVGPEGGFGPRDRDLLGRHGFVRPVSLGPRILRAETASIVGLALLQAPVRG